MLFKSRKAQLNADRVLNSIIAIVIAAAVVGGTIALVLNGFLDVANNLTAENVPLTILFTTVLPLLLAVGLFIGFRKLLKF